jgi:hypothetical protein
LRAEELRLEGLCEKEGVSRFIIVPEENGQEKNVVRAPVFISFFALSEKLCVLCFKRNFAHEKECTKKTDKSQ